MQFLRRKYVVLYSYFIITWIPYKLPIKLTYWTKTQYEIDMHSDIQCIY